MKRRLSLKTKKEEGKQAEEQVATPAVKQRKQRSPRPFNIFRYRGVTFFLMNKGDRTAISIVQENGQPEFQTEVPKSEAKRAAQALAKIALTEQYLSGVELPHTIETSLGLEGQA